jgi:hypothetical protein
MEWMSDNWGGGMHSDGQGSFWPYIGVDRAMSHLLRGERDKVILALPKRDAEIRVSIQAESW